MSTIARGTFQVVPKTEPPYHVADGITLARTHFDKRFEGDLVATSTVEMLSAMTSTKGSAGYVAIELLTGSLAGREGSFVMQHTGSMNRGVPTLSVTIVADSGTGALAGISGAMQIEIKDGKHSYVFEYSL